MTSAPLGRLSNISQWTVEVACEKKKVVVDLFRCLAGFTYSIFTRSSRRVRMIGSFILLIFVALTLWHPNQLYEIPQVSLEYTNEVPTSPISPFNASKVALLIENRPLPILSPLILHFMSVVPPDWRFRFMGSDSSVAAVNSSFAIRNQVQTGKLDLTYIPANMSTSGSEQISRFLTNRWLYETVLQPAEWLLVFQTDSILCANSKQSLNDWLEYDWVGAPWDVNGRFGGNGGLSLRRVSAIIEVLKNQERENDTLPEDVWLCEQLSHRPGAKMANGTTSLTFSGEMHSGQKVKVGGDKGSNGFKSTTKATKGASLGPPTTAFIKGIDDWRDGFYEPMGYHTGSSGVTLHGAIWGTPALRKHIWDYCPEMKMTLRMDAARYVPGQCNNQWRKRHENSGAEKEERGYGGEEAADDGGYPYVPELVPW